MTAPRIHATSNPMGQPAPIAPMAKHDAMIAGIAPGFPWGRFIGGVAVLAGLCVVVAVCASALP